MALLHVQPKYDLLHSNSLEYWEEKSSGKELEEALSLDPKLEIWKYVLIRCANCNSSLVKDLGRQWDKLHLQEQDFKELCDGMSIFRNMKDPSGEWRGFTLKTRFLKAQNLAVAFAVKCSREANNTAFQVRAVVQGLSREELQNVLRDAESKFPKGFSYWAIITALISTVLTNNARKTKDAIEKLKTPRHWGTDDAIQTIETYNKSPEKLLQLVNLRSRTQYFLHLLSHIESDDDFKADGEQEGDFEPSSNSEEQYFNFRGQPLNFRELGMNLKEPNTNSKAPNMNSKFTAMSQQHEIERSLNEIDKFLYAVALKALVDSRQDSSSMKAISALTLAFLPATFSAIFWTMPIFNWEDDSKPFLKSGRFWIYWVFTLSLTGLVSPFFISYLENKVKKWSTATLRWLKDFLLWWKYSFRLERTRDDQNRDPEAGEESEDRGTRPKTEESFAPESPILKREESKAIVREIDGDGKTRLHREAELGHDDTVWWLLKNGSNVKAKDNEMKTALHYAAKNGRIPVVKLLLDQGADVQEKDNDGRTALHLAAVGNRDVPVAVAVAKMLLKKGADVQEKDNDGRTALHLAAENENKEMVRLLLKKGADVLEKDHGGVTALHWAAWKGNEEVVMLLIDNGGDIQEKDNDGETALHWAAGNGNRAVVVLLMGNREDAILKDNHGWTALHCAARNMDDTVMRELLAKVEKVEDIWVKDNTRKTALHWAVRYMNEAVIELLLEKEGEKHVREKDNNDATALHWAALNKNKAVVSREKDSNGATALHLAALHWAAVSKKKAVVSRLIQKGANVHDRDNNGATALHWAAGNRSEAVASLPIEKGADVNEAVASLLIEKGAELNEAVVSLLIESADVGEAVARLLIEKRAVANEAVASLLMETGDVNEAVASLLIESADVNKEVASLLIEKGADVNAADENDETALHWAVRNEDLAVMEVLLRNGVDYELADKDGYTALQWAFESGNEAVKSLLDRYYLR